MSNTSKTSRVKLTSSNLHELFDHFELPEDTLERLAIVSQLVNIFNELRFYLIQAADVERRR